MHLRCALNFLAVYDVFDFLVLCKKYSPRQSVLQLSRLNSLCFILVIYDSCSGSPETKQSLVFRNVCTDSGQVCVRVRTRYSDHWTESSSEVHRSWCWFLVSQCLHQFDTLHSFDSIFNQIGLKSIQLQSAGCVNPDPEGVELVLSLWSFCTRELRFGSFAF